MVDLSLKPALTAAGMKKAAKALASIEASPAASSYASSAGLCMKFSGLHWSVCTSVHPVYSRASEAFQSDPIRITI